MVVCGDDNTNTKKEQNRFHEMKVVATVKEIVIMLIDNALLRRKASRIVVAICFADFWVEVTDDGKDSEQILPFSLTI